MFFIDIEGKIEQLPYTITSTQDIFDEISKSRDIHAKNYAIVYNSIYLNKNDNILLADIGYNPKEILLLKSVDKKKVFFSLQNISFQYTIEIESYFTCFDAQSYFAKEFLTVPQNILIQFNNNIILDYYFLFDYNNTPSTPFEICLENGYSIFRVLFKNFYLVCMKNDSTLIDLKSTISAYHSIELSNIKYGNEIKSHFNGLNDQELDNLVLSQITSQINFFDFDFLVQEANPKEKFWVTIELETCKEPIILNYSYSTEVNVYMITCLLEKMYGIERSLFIALSERKQLDLKEIIGPTVNNKLYIRISNQISVRISRKIFKYSYFTNIKDLKYIDKFELASFGIIINNHFVYDETGEKMLIHFLNNSNNHENVTNLILKSSFESCHLRTFSLISVDNKLLKKVKCIVSDEMELDQIFKVYLHKNIDSIKILKIEGYDCVFTSSSSRAIQFLYIDENNESKLLTVTINGRNPSVLDFLTSVYKLFHQSFGHAKNKYDMYEAFFNDVRLNFCDKLSDILYDNEHFIIVKGFYYQNKKSDKEKTISICDFVNKSQIDLPFSLLTAKEIIKQICDKKKIQSKDKLKLFIEFQQIKSYYYPTIYKQKYNQIILNTVPDQKNFVISNSTPLLIKFSIDKTSFEKIGSIINSMFNLKENQSRFSYIVNSEHPIPSNFNAASIPDKSKIVIYYKYVKKNRIIIEYLDQTKTVFTSIDQTVDKIISVIQEKFKVWSFSLKSLNLSFNNFIFPSSHIYSAFMIPHFCPISLKQNENSFPIFISTRENAFNKQYFFNEGETIKDAENHLKKQFKIDYNATLTFAISQNGSMNLTKNMKLFFICRKTSIKCEGSLGNDDILISEIALVSDALNYVKKRFNEDDISFFTYNEELCYYEEVDLNQCLYEFKNKLFAHKIISEIKFCNLTIKVSNEKAISELNTISFLKKNYLAKKVISLPEKIKIVENKSVINDIMLIKDAVKLNLNIVFEQSNVYNQSDAEKDTFKSKLQQSKSKLSYFMPKTKPIAFTNEINNLNSLPIKNNTNETTSLYSTLPVIKSTDNVINENEKNIDQRPNTQQVNIPKPKSLQIKSKKKFFPKISKIDVSSDSDSENKSKHEIKKELIKKEDKSNDLTKGKELDKDDQFIHITFYMYENQISLRLKEESTILEAKKEISKLKGNIKIDSIYIFHEGRVLNDDINFKNIEKKNDNIFQLFIKPSFIDNILNKSQQKNEIAIYDSKYIENLLENCIDKIGHGSQSNVYKVHPNGNKTDTSHYWAIKIFQIQLSESFYTKVHVNKEKIDRFFFEYLCLNTLNHPNIIKTYGFSYGDKNNAPSIILEYCENNLENLILKLTNIERVGIIYEICYAMKYIHELNIIHRDLKPPNILLDSHNHVKISDFGICTLGDGAHTNGIGSLRFMAPELSYDNDYDEKVDVYSFGVILYYIMTKGKLVMFNNIVKEEKLISLKINKITRDLIMSCLSESSKNRPSFSEIVNIIIDNKFKLFDDIDDMIPSLLDFLGLPQF